MALQSDRKHAEPCLLTAHIVLVESEGVEVWEEGEGEGGVRQFIVVQH